MVAKDLSAKQVGNLELSLGGRTYIVRPPSARDGELLLKIVVLGFASASVESESQEEISEEAAEAVVGQENIPRLSGEHALERLSLGKTFDKMFDDEGRCLPAIGLQLDVMAQQVVRFATSSFETGRDLPAAVSA